ncbi:subtilisin-like protease [Triticum aestivum]|uniref:subtilisin-like protease n=1 Tax=Triticum aestivum TaxID=4565 RepID=UPI001D032525|nr:subtilisin-like protease [Triticum aestivum]
MMYPATTRSPEFLSLSKDAGLWPKSSYGKGIIIGVIDSGIESRHPSFDDAGMSPPPARWKGTCTGLVRPGVVFVTSAGNDGPDPSTVNNDTPWEITVGAGSVDRKLAAGLLLESGDLVEGEALVQGPNSTAYQPLHYPGEGNLCRKVSVERTRGHIVICDDAMVKVDVQARIIKNLYDNGAAQVVLIGQEKAGFTLGFREYGSSVVQEPAAVGHKLKDYSQYPDSAAQVFFKDTQIGVGQSPTVAYFSSRGPSRGNPRIVKPDILAPGLNILAAATESPDRGPFRFKSGTSMAVPHISGVVALLKSMHPDWSPMAIRSAIMTTADELDNDGNPIMNEKHEPASAFAVGAGHVNPRRAVDPGLVYDLEVRDYVGYVCHLFARARLDNDDDYAVQDILQDLNLNCRNVPHLSDVDLNYPSIMVPANTTVRRTLTNMGPAEQYTGRLSMAHDVGVDFSPKSLSFSRPGEKLTFQVNHHGSEVAEGFLIWESNTHTVQSPLVVVRS